MAPNRWERPLVALVVVVVSILAILPNARAPPTLVGQPTLTAFDSDGDGRNDAAHVLQVVNMPQGTTTATLEGHLFPPTADPNASWSGWVGGASQTQTTTCTSGGGCDTNFTFDLRVPPGSPAGDYIVVLNVTVTPSITDTIIAGTQVGGTFPASVSVDDGDLLQYREGADPVGAEIAYRSTSGADGTSSPKTRAWDGSSWGGETEEATAGSPIRAIRMAHSPTAGDERIIVTQSDDGSLDAYVCRGTCTVTNDIGQVWTGAPTTPEKRFDIAYESQSGEALLVYGVVSTDPAQDIAYRTYSSGAWGPEQFLDDAGEAADIQYSVINLASKMGTNEIGLIGGDDTNNNVNAWIWDGSAFGSATEITATAENPDEEQMAIAWESSSGNLMAVAAEAASATFSFEEFTTSWSAAATATCAGITIRWMSLKPNPLASANDMILAVGDNNGDLHTCYWDGSAWAAMVTQDTTLDYSTQRAFDFAWENTGSKGLLVYGTTNGQITYRNFTAPSTWDTATNVAMGSQGHRWVELRTNPMTSASGTKIAGVALDNSNDLGAFQWNGTSLTVAGSNVFTNNVGNPTYDSFDFGFRRATGGGDRLIVRYDLGNLTGGGTHTLYVTGYRGDEDVDVQVLSPPSSWTTRLTINATTDTRYTYALTTTEYNGGSPSIQFVDTGNGGAGLSDLWVDWVAVRSAPPAGTTTFAVIRLEPGSPGIGLPNLFEGFGLKGTLGVIATIGLFVGILAIVAVVLQMRRRQQSSGPQGRSRNKGRARRAKPKKQKEPQMYEPEPDPQMQPQPDERLEPEEMPELDNDWGSPPGT